MNWDAIGAIAEVTGAIAVVLTLAYLAVQIRQSSKLVEQNNRLLDVSIANSLRDAQNEVSRIIAGNPSAAQAFWKGLSDRAALTEAERQQFDSLLFLTFSAAQQGLATGSEETRMTLGWSLQHPGCVHWWEEYKDMFKESMKETVEELKL
jgi:hypothetical protein